MKVKKAFGYVASLVLAIIIVMSNLKSGETTVYAKDSNGDVVIVIDPGHGGYDGGAVGSLSKEADLNWDIARYMKAELETYAGVRVYVTRGSNEWHTNTGRGHFAKSVNGDFFISIHNNSSANTATNGFVAYGSVSPAYVEATKNMALNMSRYIQAAGLNLFSNGYLARQATFDATRDFYTAIDESILSGVPAVIAEHSFVTNANDQLFMNDAYNRQKVGVADATAVAEYFGLSKRTISDGQSISLERTYSAYFVPSNQKEQAISFVSSNNDIAYVRSDGLITAVNPGDAQVSYTYADGSTGTCSIHVNPVVMVGVTAGINPTVYRNSESVAAIDKSTIMVKAIYSDGTTSQLSSGYTIGDFDPNILGRQFVNVEASGFTCQLMINYDVNAEAGTYSSYLYQPTGPNTDIFVLPPIVYMDGVTGSPYTNPGITAPAPTEPPAPSEAPTVTEAQTETETMTVETYTVAETADGTESAAEITVEESPAEIPAESDSTEDSSVINTIEETLATETTEVIAEVTENVSGGNTVATNETQKVSIVEVTAESNTKPAEKSVDVVVVVLVVLIVALIILLVIAVLVLIRNNRGNSGDSVKRKKRKKNN